MPQVTMLKDLRVCLKPHEQPTKLLSGQSYDVPEETAAWMIKEKAAERASVKDKALRGPPKNKRA